MGSSMLKAGLLRAGIAATVLLLGSGAAMAQSAITLTAAPSNATLPDGQVVPMWGYSCGAALDNGAASSRVSCAPASGAAPVAGAWQPPLIRVPPGQALSITLINNLTFSGASVPTSIVIDGQLGGGLGTPTKVPSPPHPAQGTTWPGALGGTASGDTVFTPPAQAARVRSFGTEVAAGSSAILQWSAVNLRPGTYMLHSGTQPSIQHPMGLYGMLVVTDPLSTPTAPQAYGTPFDADVPLLLSEIDPVQNAAVKTAVNTSGFSATKVWNGQAGECGDPSVHSCYPPAVNYTPLYFLINGVSFDRSNNAASAINVNPASNAHSLMLRLVNAGSRMHVPSVVGSDMTLIAEDGNKLPGLPKKQSSVFLAAGKTQDVTIAPKYTGTTYTAATYALFDRALGLSTNNQRDGGMQAFINVAGGAAPASDGAVANADSYFLVAGNVLQVGQPGKGLIANDKGVYGVTLLASPLGGSVSVSPDGTFTYTPNAGTTSDSFTYCANGTVSGSTCSSGLTATVTLSACTGSCLGAAPTAVADTYSSNVASRLLIAPPGVLANDSDPSGFPLKVDTTSIASVSAGLSVSVNADGSFNASSSTPGTKTFTYRAKNSQNTLSAATTVTLNFPTASGLAVAVKDAKTGAVLTDYRWIIEEDRTIFIDPAIETSSASTPPRNVAINFHTSHTPVVAQGCVGTVSCEAGQSVLGVAAVCDVGNGKCRTDATSRTPVNPNQVHLDPTKRYYLSVLPGDAANDTETESAHSMGGAQIAAGQTAVDVFVQPLPFQAAKIAVFVFQDDNPLNGEHDGGGPITTVAQNEKGLGGFNITVLDQAGNRGDAAGQIVYDEFGQPVTNALAGTMDPTTGLDACPISNGGQVGQIVTCPQYESDGVTESPLAGQAIIANMYPGFYEIQVSPSADRMARGEEWLQTNTLDGTKAIEAFIKPGEPGYFQEFGPGGYHVAMGFANPAIINARKGVQNDGLGKICSNRVCNATINGQVTGLRMSRTPDQRVFSSGNYDAYSFTQCYASLGEPDGEDFAFAKCNPDGTFQFTGLPLGNFRVTVFDQWNDLLVDGLSTPVMTSPTTGAGTPNTNCTGSAPNLTCFYEIAVTEWRTNLYGRIFIDQNGDGVSQEDEPGLPLVPYNLRFRDGSYAGVNNTDLNGYAGFNEVFPYLNWLMVDMDNPRYKLAGVHVVYDAGGPADGTTVVPDTAGNPVNCTSASASSRCGNSTIAAGFANTFESPTAHLPDELRVPGSRYCASADCPAGDTGGGSTGRVDPGWASTQGWQGLLGNNNFIEFAMKPFKPTENGGIRGHVLYTPTRPFDDPALLLQLSWAPGVPNVKLNLYQEITGPDGTQTLKLVDTTTSTSWDDWAQGFRRNANGAIVTGSDGKAIPNMNCPGQETSSPFWYTLQNSPMGLDTAATPTALSRDSRFKCYDGWSMLSQVQPAPYNGMYKFPSVVAKAGTTKTLPSDDNWFVQLDPTRYKTNCTICTTNPDDGTPMLPAGKYVVEVVVPQGYELVKEEDKNILLGDVYTGTEAPQLFGFASVFILPDQAAINAVYNQNNTSSNPFYNPNNVLQATTNNGAVPRREGDTGSVEVFWPCVGEKRVIPDWISLFPGAEQATPFAGATKPLCDRKEVELGNQMTVLTKFYLHTSTHVAGHFTGTITNDFASEFDPFSPQFGEKFAVPNTPVGIRDFSGKEISRVYADQWGIYNGMNFSTWTVNPPSPSGYIPQMMIACMNDPGPITNPADPTGPKITDPAYNPAYSNFCYEIPFMPGQTQYLDTPVVPTMAFAAGYNLPDCEYPDTTPAIKSVLGSTIAGGGQGPWVSAAGQTLTITALGDKQVLNHAYSGPRATTAPYNKKFITRHYGFGSTAGTVTIGGVNAPVVGTWNDLSLTVSVPSTVPLCNVSNPSYKGTNATARCGELVITAANGKKSIDTVTVTVGGKAPTYVTPTSPSSNLFGREHAAPLQTAIDNAAPGDLIIVGPGTYNENLLMWKPVRLQGVGAASVTINADAHPAGKLDSWRRQVVCLFGLDLDGRPAGDYNANGSFVFHTYPGCPAAQFNKVDRNDREGIVGWDAEVNGNVAQQLQEPTLMGAYEGAGVTVLGKGVKYPADEDPFALANAGAFPAGTLYLTDSNGDCAANGSTNGGFGAFSGTSNFRCNPSRIDGVSVINSSQGGGGIFVHGWNHLLEIANTRVYANHGTLSGGIVVGTPEFGTPYIVGGVDPIPFPAVGLPGQQLGYGKNTGVKVHHNAVTSNASIGDALFSGVNSGAGGVSFCTGADSYKFNNNWVCGNLSTGDGGGVAHIGFINDGTIANNWILFNQTASPTIPTHGGGLGIFGASPDRTLPDGTECGTLTDSDCPPGLAEGTGHNLVIDANLILGNSAESGTGGGLRMQLVNGQDVIAFPRLPALWNDISVTNNIIANNVAGWDGGGVSMQDALKVRFVNNTVYSNDTTASAGVLFNTLGAPFASVPPPGCSPTSAPSATCPRTVTTSTAQAAGVVSMRNTSNLDAAIADVTPLLGVRITCPNGYGYGTGLLGVPNGSCQTVSLPLLYNNVLWKNRAFHIGVGNLGAGQQNQQKVVTLYPSLNQAMTGVCSPSGVADPAPTGNPINGSANTVYWDIGVRGDAAPTNHASGFSMEPHFSILSATGTDYAGNNNLVGSDPAAIREYCNGSRLPPEGGGLAGGFNTWVGRSETTGLYPVFALNQITPAATVDEGNNWINLSYGPLSLSNASQYTAAGTALAALGDYGIQSSSPAIGGVPNSGLAGIIAYALAPQTDFFGTNRKANNAVDIGAVEYVAVVTPPPPPPPPPVPTLTVLDNFNRSNTTTAGLGGNWAQSSSTLRVNTNQATCVDLFLQPCAGNLTGPAWWNAASFGPQQAAAFTVANTTVNGDSLMLKANGGNTNSPQSFIRVRTTGSQVIVETTTNGNALLGASFTTVATFTATVANGNTLTALVDAAGNVSVWNGTSLVGQAATGVTGGGRIGLWIPSGARVDNFAGGTVP